MFGFISGTLDRVITFASAVLFAQIPQFIQNYTQYLAGRVDEAHLYVEKMRYAAALTHKTLEAFILKFKTNPDPDFSNQGAFMEKFVMRYEELSSALTHIEGSQGVMQPVTFLQYFDWEIAKNTMPHLNFALPITLEAGVYALCGLFVGHMFFVAIKKCIPARLRT